MSVVKHFREIRVCFEAFEFANAAQWCISSNQAREDGDEI
jgi:hypothetical protein